MAFGMNLSKNTHNIRSRSRKNNKNNNISKQISSNSNQYNRVQFNSRSFPLPVSFRTTLVYYEQVSFTAVTTPQTYAFRGNSPFDPNQTGTGAQPVGYDNLATFYEEYLVIGSKIKIDIFNLGTVPVQLAVSPTMQVTTYTTYDQAAYFGNQARFLTVDGTSRGGQSFGKVQHTGVTTQILQQPVDRDFRSVFTTNPSKQWYWLIAFQSADQVTAISCTIQVTIWYDLELSGPKLVALS